MTAPTQYVNPTTELFKVAIVRLRSGLLDIMKKLIVSDTLVSKLLTLFGGAKGIRTPDLLHAKQPLSQLSYSPV